MAYLLSVAIIDKHDARIKVVHQFFGFTEEEVEKLKQDHLSECSFFRSAQAEERTAEYVEEVLTRDLPTVEDFEEEEDEEEDEEP